MIYAVKLQNPFTGTTTPLWGGEPGLPISSPAYWLAKGQGDPPRTASLDHARRFDSKLQGQRALNMARKKYSRDFPDAEVIQIEVREVKK